MKVLGGFVVTLLLLFVAADYVARNQAENQAGKQLAASLDLEEEPDVKLGGWPFLLKVLGGEIPSASFSTQEVRSRGVSLTEVEVDVRGLAFKLEDIMAGSRDAIKISGGGGTAVLAEDELGKVLRREGIRAEVRLTDAGVLVDPPRLSESVDGDISIDSGYLVITAGGSTIGTVRLPQIVDGLIYGGVTVQEDKAVLSFDLEAATLTAP